MQNVHQEHDTLIAVIGNKNGFKVRKATVGDQDPLARLEIGYPRFSARDPFANHPDDFVLYGERILVEAHDLDNASDGAPGTAETLLRILGTFTSCIDGPGRILAAAKYSAS
jgi:hypothetical protein